jgi:threonine/homoserine/homoserine lactone efflux protein
LAAILSSIAPVFAGIIYVLTPGPATLAVLGLTAEKGRATAARFYVGHMVGDVTWSVLALAAILGVSKLGPSLFAMLGLACGLYLVYLGARAMLSRGSAGAAAIGSSRPLKVGLAFGLTNPKAYPFSLAMFTALAVGHGDDFGVIDAVGLLAHVVIGFAIGDALTLYWAGLKPIRAVFHRFRGTIVRTMGIIFILFGVKTIVDAGEVLRGR